MSFPSWLCCSLVEPERIYDHLYATTGWPKGWFTTLIREDAMTIKTVTKTTDRLLYAAVNLVARDMWGADNQVVNYGSWDRGHLDAETYNEWLRRATDLVKSEATDDDYGGTPEALALLPTLLTGGS